MKAVVTIQVDRETRARFERDVEAGVQVEYAGDLRRTDVVDLCKGADVVVGADHLRAILSATPSIRLVQVPWTGVDHLCDVVRTFEGVRLANSHANAYATAQFAIGLALALMNRLREGHEIVKEGRWNDRWIPPAPVNMSHTTVGVLGAGRIGTEVARLIRPFAPRVIGLSRSGASRGDGPFDAVMVRDDLHRLLSEAGVLFVTLPLTADTRDLIRRHELDLLGPDGYLVSVGRGETLCESDLFEALQDKRIAGAAIEVWYDYEPAADRDGRKFPYNRPFHELDNVLLSPHRAGWTRPSPDFWEDIIENLNRMAGGRSDLLNEVDLQRGY